MDKMHFACFVIAVVAILQGISWYLGKNGTVFALTSLVIGGIAGSIFGFKLGSGSENDQGSFTVKQKDES
jgi:uncharacterized membrane-anchored protein